MEENYVISIIGRQYVDGEKGEIQMTTLGSYTKKGGNRFIMYREYDPDEPDVKTTSILKIEDNRQVTLIRNGGQQSRLVLEKGQRHLCHYDTGFGSMMVGVFANSITSDLTDEGGNLEVSYSLDINSGLTSMNEIFINVEEAEHVKASSEYDQ